VPKIVDNNVRCARCGRAFAAPQGLASHARHCLATPPSPSPSPSLVLSPTPAPTPALSTHAPSLKNLPVYEPQERFLANEREDLGEREVWVRARERARRERGQTSPAQIRERPRAWLLHCPFCDAKRVELIIPSVPPTYIRCRSCNHYVPTESWLVGSYGAFSVTPALVRSYYGEELALETRRPYNVTEEVR